MMTRMNVENKFRCLSLEMWSHSPYQVQVLHPRCRLQNEEQHNRHCANLREENER
jgi:hypothetical protein